MDRLFVDKKLNVKKIQLYYAIKDDIVGLHEFRNHQFFIVAGISFCGTMKRVYSP